MNIVMTNKEALEYGLKHVRSLGYIKGPIYTDGITTTVVYDNSVWTEETAKQQIEQAQTRLNEVKNRALILDRIKMAALTDSLPSADDLEYLLKYLDHPEAGNWGYSGSPNDMWSRPRSKQVRQQVDERITKIEEWERAEKQIKAMVVQVLAPNEPVQTDQWGNRWVVVPNTNPPVRKYL